MVTDDVRREARIGVVCAVSAYAIWGMVPLYFKAVAEVSAFEIIAHRVLWSLGLLAGVLALTRNRSGFVALRADPGLWGRVAFAAVLVTANWLVFVWAVNAGRVLETSLGYYINPLVSVLFAFVFLGERLRPCRLSRWRVPRSASPTRCLRSESCPGCRWCLPCRLPAMA